MNLYIDGNETAIPLLEGVAADHDDRHAMAWQA